MKALLRLSPVFCILLVTGCNDNVSSPTVKASVIANINANGLNAETLTLTNNGKVSIKNIAAPEISSALSSVLIENMGSSTCRSAVFPLAPGSSCTYQFTASGSNTVPGAQSGTIGLSLAFADGTSQNISLPASVTHYLYAGSNLGVYRWNGSAWSMMNINGNGPTNVVSLLTAPTSAGTIALYAGSNTGNSGADLQVWNGSSWTTSSGSPTNVYGLTSSTSGSGVNTIFAASTGNSTSNYNINSLTNGAWSSVGNTSLNRVRALALSNPVNGTLYAATSSDLVGGEIFTLTMQATTPGPYSVQARRARLMP